MTASQDLLSGNASPQAQPPASSSPAAAATADLPIWPAEYIDLQRFNALVGDESVLKWVGLPVDDMSRFFHKQVILDDETILDQPTIQVPGYIGIADALEVTDPQGHTVSGHADMAQVLDRYGLLICTYQWNKERYGIPIDTRQQIDPEILQEAFGKNEAHHAGALVPARRPNAAGEMIASFGALNEPDYYHDGMYGKDGFVAVAQRLVFPKFVSSRQARGYTDSIMCWMELLNPFIQFPKNYNGGDPTRVADRATLKELLRNGALAILGDEVAIAFLNAPINKTYCAEFIYVGLNSVVFPFNLQGLTTVLDGDEAKAQAILAMQVKHNNREANIISEKTRNPEFKAFNILMPVVPPDLPPLDTLLRQHGQKVDANSLPLPALRISQVIRRAFHTILPRYQDSRRPQRDGILGAISQLWQTIGFWLRMMFPPQQTEMDKKLAAAQISVLNSIEPMLLQQLGLEDMPPDNPKLAAVRQFSELVKQQLQKPFANYDDFSRVIDFIMAKVDEQLVGAGDRARFVPPRIYVDLGQNDDAHLPKGWGFRLETIGALVAKRVISPPEKRIPVVPRILQLSRPAMRGDDVSIVQGAMLRAGIELQADGIFGPATEQAVTLFQSQHGLDVTGVVGPQTRAKLGLV